MTPPRGFRERLCLMDAARLDRTLSRMAAEICERHPDTARLLLVGVHTRGVPLAERLAARLPARPVVGSLDITLYRDDLTTIAPHPLTRGTAIPVAIDGRVVIVVDDVLFTGRTVRAALDELVDFGRPARIELAVLCDRGHRELPIRADYVGETVSTAREEIVEVRLSAQDGEESVWLLEPGPAPVAPPRPAPAPVSPQAPATAEPKAAARKAPAKKAAAKPAARPARPAARKKTAPRRKR